MSIVAWDGKMIAADKQATCAEMRTQVCKIRRLEPYSSGIFLAWTGEQDGGILLAAWYEAGGKKEDWPSIQSTPDWSRLIVVSSFEVFFYERVPVRQIVKEPFMAWGSGRDFAMGAMAQGANAKEAVEIASRFNIHCGMGVDFFPLAS